MILAKAPVSPLGILDIEPMIADFDTEVRIEIVLALLPFYYLCRLNLDNTRRTRGRLFKLLLT